MGTIWQDVKYGARMLAKRKGFTLIAVSALALGIGANTAIFSVVNAVLLRPLPFPNAGRLVTIKEEDPRGGQANANGLISFPNFSDYRDRARTLQHAAAYSEGYAWLTGEDGEPERVEGVYASPGLFAALGVGAALGRTFSGQEETPDAPPVAVISHGWWQRRFGGDPGIVGREIVLDGKKTAVIGVMPRGFAFPVAPEPGDFWMPLAAAGYGETLKNRAANNHSVVAGLRPGTTLEQAQAELEVINRDLAAGFPEANAGARVRVTDLHSDLVGDVRPALLVLLGAVGFVLLIACANVANLLLARASSRGKEMAVRTALGATRARVVRQLLTESLLLSLIGGAAGLLLALWAVPALTAASPGNIPRVSEVSLDLRVLVFTLAISVLTGLLFGLAPALRASSPDLYGSLKEGGRGATAGATRSRVRSLLVVSEVALSLVLLIGAGLLLRSFVALLSTPPGYDPSNTLTASVSVSRAAYPEPEKFFQEVIARVEALPGVESAGVASLLPLGAAETTYEFRVEGRPAPGRGEAPVARPLAASPGYFRAMKIPVLRGRALSEQDAGQSAKVVLVNEALARRYFAGEDPVGKRLILNNPYRKADAAAYEIAGVVGDVRHRGLNTAPYPEYYVSYLQMLPARVYLVVRSANPEAAGLAAPVRSAIREVHKGARIWDVRTMEERVAVSVAPQRFQAILLGLFALVALVLAATGILGVMSFAVAQRTHEIGVRMALGARPRDILKMVVGHGLGLTLAGIGLGLVASFALTRVVSGLLYGVSASDPLTYSAVAVLLAAVALLACYLPARRATKVDPVVALRYE